MEEVSGSDVVQGGEGEKGSRATTRSLKLTSPWGISSPASMRPI